MLNLTFLEYTVRVFVCPTLKSDVDDDDQHDDDDDDDDDDEDEHVQDDGDQDDDDDDDDVDDGHVQDQAWTHSMMSWTVCSGNCFH